MGAEFLELGAHPFTKAITAGGLEPWRSLRDCAPAKPLPAPTPSPSRKMSADGSAPINVLPRAGHGCRRVGAELRHQGDIVNHKKLRRLMREHNLLPQASNTPCQGDPASSRRTIQSAIVRALGSA